MTSTPDDTWVVVADAGLTRLFRTDAAFSDFAEIPIKPDAHTPPSASGHVDKHDKHEIREQAAARALAHELNQAHNQHRFRDLVLVASPAFLGMVRAELPTGTARAVTASIHHDYAHKPIAEIKALVQKNLGEQKLPR